ncbi:MAG TPA: restriction endonuclease [Ktedonobacterales bacterium]|nr:restriction endonuclease [Ktedonobacterales bacterium]
MAQRRVARRHASADYHRWLLALIFGAGALSLMSGSVAPLAHALVGALSQSPGVPAPLWSVAALGVVCAALALRLHIRHAHGRGTRIAWRWQPRLERTDPAHTLEALRALTPTEFELEVGAFLRRCGYHDVRHTGCAGDLAADLTCVDARGARVVVQCKRYGPGSAVTSPEMQMFIGMIYAHHRADYGVFVTTSTFTRPARALAEQHGIRLLDGASLATRLRRAAQA